MATRVPDRPLHDGEVPYAVGRNVVRTRQQHGDVQVAGELSAGVDRRLAAAIDQHHAAACKCDGRRRRDRFCGHRNEGCSLRPG